MSSFSFHNPVKVVCGEAALEMLATVSHGKRVLLVSGSASAKANGTFDTLAHILDAENAVLIDFDGVSQCTYERIAEGVELARSCDAEVVVGLGGASAMDTAKAIAFCAVHDAYDDFLLGLREQSNDEKLTLVLIPTYPSTGSEANGVSDIMGYKGGIQGVYADYALLYPPFTFSLDARNTTYSTMVMLAQTGYRYFGDRNAISRRFTAASLRSVLEAYEVLLTDPKNYDARTTMLWASFLETSGLLGLETEDKWTYSIFSAAGLLRFSMGTVYRQNLAMVFPRWLIFAARHHPDEVRDFAINVMGASADAPIEDAAHHAFDRCMALLRSGGLPTTLEELGPIPRDKAIVDAVSKVSSREFTIEEYLQMVRACESESFPGF